MNSLEFLKKNEKDVQQLIEMFAILWEESNNDYYPFAIRDMASKDHVRWVNLAEWIKIRLQHADNGYWPRIEEAIKEITKKVKSDE